MCKKYIKTELTFPYYTYCLNTAMCFQNNYDGFWKQELRFTKTQA